MKVTVNCDILSVCLSLSKEELDNLKQIVWFALDYDNENKNTKMYDTERETAHEIMNKIEKIEKGDFR